MGMILGYKLIPKNWIQIKNIITTFPPIDSNFTYLKEFVNAVQIELNKTRSDENKPKIAHNLKLICDDTCPFIDVYWYNWSIIVQSSLIFLKITLFPKKYNKKEPK